jgi:predicted DNA-binding mobile mystery protein A
MKNALQRQQLNSKMESFSGVKNIAIPSIGWIKAIRTGLNMSMQQLGHKLGVSKQAVLDIERRESQGAITIRSLREVAQALNMELVYGFVPKEGSLNELIEARAKQLATDIVMRTANTMQLEDQANSYQRIEAAIEERKQELIQQLPAILWD